MSYMILSLLLAGYAPFQDYTENQRLAFFLDADAFCDDMSDPGDIGDPEVYCLDAQTDQCIVYLENCLGRKFIQGVWI